MESFEKKYKRLQILQTSHSIKCNIISKCACLAIPKHSTIPKVSTQNSRYVKVLEGTKRTFYEPTERIIYYRSEII